MRCWLDLLGGSGYSIKFVGWEWLELAASHLPSGSALIWVLERDDLRFILYVLFYKWQLHSGIRS